MSGAQTAYADVLLVTATMTETKAVREAFGVTVQEANPPGIGNRAYFDLGTVNGARVMMTQSEMSAGSPGGSQQAVQQGIATLSPAAVVMVGIAFGMHEEEQRIGDILVAEHLYLYENQRVGTQVDGSTKVVVRGDKPPASAWLRNLLKSVTITWRGAEVMFGTILTGNKLVDNLEFREQLRFVEPGAIGGEMEGAGLFVACHEKKVDWILVKAISDFANGRKGENEKENQALAAKNAAIFVHHALRSASVQWQEHNRPSRHIIPAHAALHSQNEITAKTIWKKKAAYLQAQHATTSNPALKFELECQIDEALAAIQRLGG